MDLSKKPDTLRTSSFREWVKLTFLSNHLKLFPVNERTLDIGCGWGFSFKLNPHFFGVDADKACISALEAKGYQVKWADVSKPLPYDAAYFDNAFTHDVLEHLTAEAMDALFADVRRILKPGGLFLNIVPNQKGFNAGLDPTVGHIRFVDLPAVHQAASKNGFQVVRSWYSPLPSWLSELFVHNKLVVLCRAI